MKLFNVEIPKKIILASLLTCRSAMYVWTIIKARQMGIKYITDGARKDQGFVPKTLEPQCLIGVSLPGGKTPDTEIQNAVENYFDKIVLPQAKKLIATQSKAILEGEIL